jgi:ribonuclease HI
LLLAESAASFVDEFNIVNVAAPRSSHVPENIRKDAPAAGTLKVNIDAGCMLNGTTCWGKIVRNDVAAVSYAATLKVSPMLVETLGLRWALLWLKEQHFDEVINETDAEQVIKYLKNQIKVSEISNVILDCLALLAEMEQVSVSFLSRKRNLAAHSLVGVASSVGSKSWVGNVPYQIDHIICNDFVLS